MALQESYKAIIDNAVKAVYERVFFAQYPEHPKAYGEEAAGKGATDFNNLKGKPYSALLQADPEKWVGEESSPYTLENLDITYPAFSVDTLIKRADVAFKSWRKVPVDERANILIDSLERIKEDFHLIAQATMHSTGQSYMMSFQASGPHSNDRALEALAMGYDELTRFPSEVTWIKPMGKFDITLQKEFKPVPKGIGLVIGCSTFPVWNSVPGLYADLITGNAAIVKPHPKSVLPIAIVVAHIQQALQAAGHDPNIVQLAPDSSDALITKELAENQAVKLIDYTGGSAFGNYVEALPNKTVFTEKAGVNSVILDSAPDLGPVMQNLAFAVSLYSGQMCTAPQNFFIPETGVKSGDEIIPYEKVVEMLRDNVSGLVNHPKMGAGTLGAVQNETTLHRNVDSVKLGGNVVLEPGTVENPEFKDARIATPSILEVSAADKDKYEQELFGPIVLIVKTKDTDESIRLAQEMAQKHGAITCGAYTTDEAVADKIVEAMEEAFTPVSLNFTGFIWVNQHAAFSDFHVTGGNPAGNASFTNAEFINKRFVWVGHRRLN